MASDFAISDFLSKVDNLGGIARKNRFSVEITPPTTMVTEIQSSAISFLAKTISFPARTFGTTTYRTGGQFALNVPYETTFEPVSLTMLDTNDHTPRKFWTDWLEHIQHTGSKGYNMQYYKSFIGLIKISSYNDVADNFLASDPGTSYQVTLHEAYPKSISAIELGWESSELVDFDIDIAYSRWEDTSG